MPTTQTPFSDYQVALMQAQRAQSLANALRQQSFQPIESYDSGALKAPISWTQGLAKMLQAYTANKGEEKAIENMGKAYGMQNQMYQGMFGGNQGGGTTLTTGAPMQMAQNGPQPTPDIVNSAITGQQPQQQVTQPQTMSFQPNGQQALRLPPGMTPAQMAYIIQTMPTIGSQIVGNYNKPDETTLMLMNAGINPSSPQAQTAYQQKLFPPISGREGAPVYRMNPQTGQMEIAAFTPKMDVGMMPTSQGIQVAPGYGQAKTELGSIPNPSAPMIDLQTSSGQKISLTQPEYLNWQRSGQLPVRFGGRPATSGPNTPVPTGKPIVPPTNKPIVRGKGLGVVGATQPQSDVITQKASEEMAKQAADEMRVNYARLREAPQQLQNIEEAKAKAIQAGGFMGPLGETKLNIAKFLHSNMGFDVDVEGVKSAEELRTRLFSQIMDNLKKMDAQPSQMQQIIMMNALGNLGTDPRAMPNVLDAIASVVRSKVELHNQTVMDAENRGMQFPYSMRIELPKSAVPASQNKSGTPKSNFSHLWGG